MKPKPFLAQAIDGAACYARNAADNTVWHQSRTRTLYADTDRSQVVYHGNYLRYFEFGRASLMRDIGYPYLEIEKSGYIYPIIEIGVRYFSPLHYDDPMIIYTKPIELERVKIKFDYVITHEGSGSIVCTGFTQHCATNPKGVPVEIDPKTRELWKNFPR
jgi:acyl-CoA thioester hydrolase